MLFYQLLLMLHNIGILNPFTGDFTVTVSDIIN